MKRPQTYLVALSIIAILLVFSSGCKKRIFYPHVDNGILPLAIGNEWNYNDTAIFIYQGTPVDTIVREWSLRVAEMTEFKTGFRKWIEAYRLDFEGGDNCTSRLYLHSSEEGIVMWQGEVDFFGNWSSEYFNDLNFYLVKFPVSEGDSWQLDFNGISTQNFRCGPPRLVVSSPTFPSFDLEDGESEIWSCLSTNTLINSPAGNFTAYNFSGEFWSEGVGKVGADRIFWKQGTEANPEFELHLKTELVDYHIN